MNSATQQSAGLPSPVAGQERRLNIGGMPKVPLMLFLFALAGVILVVAASWYTLQSLREALRGSAWDGWWITAGAGVLALASLAVVRPLWRAFQRCRGVRAAALRMDIVAARIERSDACVQSWIALGHTLAQFLVVLGFQFLLANNQAVAKTFFLVPLIVKTFPLVLDAFWVNVKIFLIAEVLVLLLLVAFPQLVTVPASWFAK